MKDGSDDRLVWILAAFAVVLIWIPVLDYLGVLPLGT